MNNKEFEKEAKADKKSRLIMMIVIIIIIILSLLTSCSCTSKFFGRLGDMFRNEKTIPIKPDSGDKEVIRNRELKFDTDHITISMSDKDAKISFSYERIHPDKFTCTTSDASIALCYVTEDGYVGIIPVSPGEVKVIVKTETNGKIYEAETTVTILESNKYIALSSNKGTINLRSTNYLYAYYKLVGINGTVSITSSDANIATATAQNGVIKFIGKKVGKAVFTITVNDHGEIYQKEFTLNVVDKEVPVLNNDSSLKNLSVSTGSLKPNFDSHTKNYVVSVSKDTNKISIWGTPNNDKSKVVYTYQNKNYSSFEDIPLTSDNSTVKITVIAEDKTTSIYTVQIKKEGTPSLKDSDSSLKNITTNHGVLSPSFKSSTLDYKIEVEANIKNIDVKGLPNSNKAKVVYVYNNKEYTSTASIPLKTGDNLINIVVSAEDGSITTYTVNVVKKADSNSKLSSLTLKNIDYTPSFNEDTLEYMAIINEDIKSTNVKTTPSSSTSKVNYYFEEKEYKALEDMPLKDGENVIFVVVTAEDGSTSTYKVNVHKYYLKSEREYSVSYSSQGSKKDIIVYSNILNGEVTVSKINDKELKVCEVLNSNTCIRVSSSSSILDSISYNLKEDSPTSLPFEISANNVGDASIHIIGQVNGKIIKEYDVILHVTQKYLVKVSANGGLFSELTSVYEYLLSSEDDPINLALIEEPYLVDETNPCIAYKFIGYSKEGDTTNTIIYDRESKNIISYHDLNGDLTILANYDKNIKQDLTTEHKTLWVVDEPVFRDLEYYTKNLVDRPIYPGAKGEYTLHITNESENKLVITGMTLKEDTVCVDKNGVKGCLNMGYIIKDSNNITHYGASNTYEVLNQNPTITKDWANNYNATKFDFKNSLEVAPKGEKGSEVEITIHWKWVEFDETSDKIDTYIGNQSYETDSEWYKLYIGLDFDVIRDNCKN